MKKTVSYTVENLEFGYKTRLTKKVSINPMSDELTGLFKLKSIIANEVNKTYENFIANEVRWNMDLHHIEILDGGEVVYIISNLKYV